MRPCPRCDCQEVMVIGTSPVEGCWELYRCSRCQYVWRSTETAELLSQTVKVGKDGIQTFLDSHTHKMRRLPFLVDAEMKGKEGEADKARKVGLKHESQT